MHGCSSASHLVVNAEVDSMGGVVEGGVGVGTKTSPRRAAIEKVQAELRQEYDVREERRRELEFLEKGGNPLDFKFGNAASVSVQSTSLTDQHPEIFLTSEAKGSFAFTASPRGDSVESSGRPGAHSACEPNSADNLMLFDGENDSVEGDRNSVQPNKNNIMPTQHSFPLDGSQNAKETGESAGFGRSRKAYIRRNRSRTSRDGARSSSTDVLLAHGGQASPLPSRHGLRDSMGLVSDANNQKIQKISSNGDPKPTSSDVVTVCKTVPSGSQLDMELDGVKAVESTDDQVKDVLANVGSEANALKNLQDEQHNPESVSDAQKTTVDKDFEEIESFKGREEVSVSVGAEIEPCLPVTRVENQASSGQENGFTIVKGDDKSAPNDGVNSTTELGIKVLDSESSCTQTSLSLDGNNESEMCTNQINTDSNGIVKEHTPVIEAKPPIEGDPMIKETKEINADNTCTIVNDECNSGQGSHKENGFISRSGEEMNGNVSGLQDKVKNQNQTEVKDEVIVERMEEDGCDGSETQRKNSILLGEDLNAKDENVCTDSSIIKLLDNASPTVSAAPPEEQTPSDINMKASKADEDSILEEARTIEAKRKRIAELSVASLPVNFRRKSQWDYVLEEMAWLANDFAQERLWKLTAAAQICHRAASASRLRFNEQNNYWEHKKVARILARAIMEFWHSVEETRKQQQMQCPKKESAALREYKVRFLKHNNSDVLHGQAEAPVTPDRVSDFGILDMSLDDYLTEENIFYAIPPFATENYRHSIESHVVKFEKTASSLQEEVETSACDAVADFGSQYNAYEEDEGETSAYDTSVAFDASKSSRFSQKRWKNSQKAYSGRTFEVVADSQFMQCMENKVGSQQPVLGKRPNSSLNVSFPTKRVRTSNRQRISPFSAGTSACLQVPHKTDASSGDTNSFQDDHSTLHGGSHVPNNLEVDSVADFEKPLPFDSMEVSTKSKKKKNMKHSGSAYDQRWLVDSNFQNDQFQRDHSKKRSEGHQLESNGSSGLFGQHVAKKQKIMRPSLDNSFDSATPVGGSAPSPVASQISNPNRLMKYFGGRDRGRKNKILKMPASQSDSGSPWSLFEDQALVVLVHDLGPNWELVSDAINSTLQFKCIFRNPRECKERHKLLMDKPTGDGADSADDSGSSQIYESTLPGIPKGSARQLFQKLQGPMEEDTLKSHFEKIITIGQKLHCRRKQNECHDPKQLQQPHGSHMLALTQVCPNNLNGGPVLTPLDLCDATASSPDLLSFSFQGPHNGGLAISSPGTMAPLLNASGANSAVPGSSSMIIGNNLPSSSGPVSASVRDGRYAVPRSASLPIDEQQRMQQYNQMLSSRNIPQSNLSSPGALPANDRGVRLLPSGNGIGMTGGINRSLPIARPGFQGIGSSSILNSGSMISSGMVAMPSPVNMHTGVGPGQGNSLRPRDVHMMRPSHNQDPQRQMMAPELQMQVSQGNNQGVAPFGALSSSFPNQTASPPVSSYPIHHQQSHGVSPQQPHVSSPHNPHLQGTNHATNPQHQAFALRLAKERQLQQRLLQQQQQQQQFASSNSMIPHVQPQAQLPISPPQNSSQVATPTVSHSPLASASPVTAMPQHQQKHQVLPHGLARSAPSGSSGLTNQVGKQRQRQPQQQQQQQQQQFQQASRHHPQQRQQTQSQQQAKVLKGVGRGNMMMHQNMSMDPSLLNGLSTNSGNQSAEKGDQTMHLLQGQNLYSGNMSTLNSVQSGKSLVPHSSNQSQPHQKMYSGQASPMSKHLQQMPSHSDNNSNQGHISPVASGPPLSTGHQSVSPMAMTSSSHPQPQLQTHQKLVNQSQSNVQRVVQNRHVNAEPPTKLQGRESQADQIPMTNSSPMGAITTMPQASNDATSVSQVVSSAGGPQWRAAESLYDCVTSNPATNLSSLGTPPANSASTEPSSHAGHGLGQRQSSGNLPPVGHDVSTQWQQQPSPLQQPTSPVSQQQQQASPQQLPPPSHSQQQVQLVGNSSLFVRPTDSRLE